MSNVPPAVRRGRRNRQKGAEGEREVAAILRQYGWPKAHRNLGRDVEGIQVNGDIADGPEGVCMDAKWRKNLSIRTAMEQCEAAAGLYDIPVVAHRPNGDKRWLATLPLDDLLPLLALRERG